MQILTKFVVITGATSGVGELTSLRFSSSGWTVIGIARNGEKLKQLSNRIGSNFIPMQADIKLSNTVEAVFKKIKKYTKKIDLLINNAAVFKNAAFNSCSIDDIDEMINTNLKGAMYVTLSAIKLMKSSNNGARIINISSVAGTHGIENQAIYCASKFGLNGFSEALNQELIGHNISITTLFPGGINTPLWNENNPYPGTNKAEILESKDIVDLIEYVSKLEPRIILKNLTVFPINEWH